MIIDFLVIWVGRFVNILVRKVKRESSLVW